MLSLKKFQAIEKINSSKDINEDDKVFHSLCIMEDISPIKLNEMNPKKVVKMIEQMGRKFSKINTKPIKAINFRFKIKTNITTFGRYMEMIHFFQNGEYENAHHIIASCCYGMGYTHKRASLWALSMKASIALTHLKSIAESLNEFNKGYRFLFDSGGSSEGAADDFSKNFGWFYSASKLAEYERIPLEEVYNMPASKALHGLCYLKAKADNELKQMNNVRK